MWITWIINCQDRKVLNDDHLKTFAAAYTGRGAGNVPEPFGVAFHYVHPTFIDAYILCQGSLAFTTWMSVSSRTGRRSMFYKHLLF